MPFRVGNVGLGIMGGPVAKNILTKGKEAGTVTSVTVWNRTASKAEPLVALGAVAAASPFEVAKASDVIFTNLTDSCDVESVILDKGGILDGCAAGAIIVDNSTILPEVAKKIAAACKERGVVFLDAPVSGGEPGAINGTLSVMVGGSEAALDQIRPILAHCSKSVTYIGASGSGQVAKAANQIMVAAQITALAELMVFTEKMGVDVDKVCQAIRGGAAGCWTLDNKPQRLLAGNRNPGFHIRNQCKDLQIVAQTAAANNVAMPCLALNAAMFKSAMAQGEGELDNAAVIGVFERMNGVQIGPKEVAK